MKTDQTLIQWMLNGYNGRDYVEKSLTVSKNTWFHVALRFNDRTVSIFINGSLVQTGSINEEVVGFSLYDDNMFGSSVFYDNIRLYDGALSATDIGKDKSGASDKLVQNWCTPFRMNGEKGDKGDKGESPAAVYQGTYSGSKTYYGTKYRLDVVKYNGIFYIARIDAGTFSGVVPTNTSKWNPFGAQFESVATNLLLAENANIAGWVFRNNRLESQNGSVYLDGVNGKVRVNGIVQFSTAYQGNISDSNLFYLPSITSDKNMKMGYEREDIGKVCRLYNSSPYGGGTYQIYVAAFGIKENFTDATIGSDKGMNYYVLVPPQTCVELTCFELPKTFDGTTYEIVGRWDVTGRFGQTDFVTAGAKGRHPLILAIGRISGTNSGASISGTWWDGKSITSVLSVSRQDTGKYRVSFSSTNVPSGYRVMLTGYGYSSGSSDAPIKGTIYTLGSTYFDVLLSDDASRNDGSCEFIIFAPAWQYNM